MAAQQQLTTTTTTAPTTTPTGTEDRFGEVYAAYWPRMVAFIVGQVRVADRQVVEDLTQITFLRAWRYLHTVDVDDPARMYGWLATIARHAVADHYRRGPRAAETPTPPDAVVWHSTATAEVDEVEAVEERVALGAALAGLPAETRRAVVLRVAAGLPIAVVARRMHRG